MERERGRSREMEETVGEMETRRADKEEEGREDDEVEMEEVEKEE